MTYISDGYGQKGFGGGVLSSTTFQASWAEKANPNLFKASLNDWTGDKQIFNRCSNILKQAGYLSATNVVKKSMNFENEPKLPVECKGKVGFQISKLIAKKQMPKFYGYRYAYGNHQELIKAKYFSDKESMKAEPLQADSFSKELSNFKIEESHDVWKILTSAKFLTTDQRNNDIKFAVGKPGTESIVRVQEIEAALSSLASPTFNALKVAPEIVNLIVRTIHQKQFFTAESFEKDFLGFYGLNAASTDWQSESVKKNAAKVFEKLSAASLLQKSPKLFTPLNPKLVHGLKNHFRRIPDIINVLSSHFSNAIGESPFDLYSYNIDANGNHRLFYNGFERFEINYQGDSNKISNIKLDDITSTTPQASYDIKHDANGNIVKALHRNIEEIEYFTTSQRTKKVSMTDGRVIKFFYDVAGERILKQVLGPRGQLISSTKYTRDEKGKVLMDKKTIFKVAPEPHQVLVTKYIYGPRGLIGFVRNGEFLSVTTDHAGSIRLVIRNGEVVVSYDYLPYGDLMRKFVKNSAYEIDYRFTGQEIDEETGLYNYHARFYDPSIGRFYQIDPLAQYFSPYLYSGNSPISFVDPDGQFAFLIVVGVLAISGAYLGGSKANNSWNPAKWNWQDPNTFAGIGFGAFSETFSIDIFLLLLYYLESNLETNNYLHF